jgi:hypothetical protein
LDFCNTIPLEADMLPEPPHVGFVQIRFAAGVKNCAGRRCSLRAEI